MSYFFMNKNMLVLSLFFSWGLVTAMEERNASIEEVLPAEMNLYLTQFLGSNLPETLRSIAALSQVDKYFNSLITQNPNIIGQVLRSRFPDGRLAVLDDAAVLSDSPAVVSNKFQIIKNFLAKNIVDIGEVLNAAVVNLNFDLIDYLYANGLLNNDASLLLDQRGLVTPLDFVLSSDFIGTGSPEFLAQAIIRNGADVNQLIRTEQVRPLYWAMKNGNWDLFERLLEFGANPALTNQDGTSVLQYIKENPDDDNLGTFKWMLNEKGFDVAMKVNARRGRTFTVQRKKIQHRGRSMVRNSRKYNRQSV